MLGAWVAAAVGAGRFGAALLTASSTPGPASSGAMACSSRRIGSTGAGRPAPVPPPPPTLLSPTALASGPARALRLLLPPPPLVGRAPLMMAPPRLSGVFYEWIGDVSVAFWWPAAPPHDNDPHAPVRTRPSDNIPRTSLVRGRGAVVARRPTPNVGRDAASTAPPPSPPSYHPGCRSNYGVK